MRIFKTIIDFYIESSLHVAFAVYALLWVTFFKLNIPYAAAVTNFGFFGSIAGYNFIKYDELARIKKVELTTKFKLIIGLSLISLFASVFYFFQLQTNTKVLGIFTLVLTVLYTLPFIPSKENLRNWSGIKIYLVAIAWVVVTLVLPIINADLDFSIIVIITFIQRFILVFVLMLIFEIIDLKVDNFYLKTIPQQIGTNKTKYLSYFLLFLFVILESVKPSVIENDLVITLLIVFLIAIFTFFANFKRNHYYTSFWVESVPIVWLALLLLFG